MSNQNTATSTDNSTVEHYAALISTLPAAERGLVAKLAETLATGKIPTIIFPTEKPIAKTLLGDEIDTLLPAEQLALAVITRITGFPGVSRAILSNLDAMVRSAADAIEQHAKDSGDEFLQRGLEIYEG